ncbi:hypothetical protein QJQ45_026077 [Haematococcus lacustris]|nr:hypothetical protein QJQ45_026077 [Haematococcus lacustris]
MGTQAPAAIDRCGLPLQKLHLLYLWRLPLLPGPPHCLCPHRHPVTAVPQAARASA